jgi:hypothetical protein
MDNNESATVGVHITGVLKKYTAKPDGGDWTDEELASGLADEHLYEVLTFEDGVITNTWRKED